MSQSARKVLISYMERLEDLFPENSYHRRKKNSSLFVVTEMYRLPGLDLQKKSPEECWCVVWKMDYRLEDLFHENFQHRMKSFKVCLLSLKHTDSLDLTHQGN